MTFSSLHQCLHQCLHAHIESSPSQVCRQSSFFIGNVFSSFSFLLRESKLALGTPERAAYYNLHAEATLSDLSREEALRWDVLPLGVGAETPPPEARRLDPRDMRAQVDKFRAGMPAGKRGQGQ